MRTFETTLEPLGTPNFTIIALYTPQKPENPPFLEASQAWVPFFPDCKVIYEPMLILVGIKFPSSSLVLYIKIESIVLRGLIEMTRKQIGSDNVEPRTEPF